MILLSFFFFNDTATTEIYTLSLHDALPIYVDPLTNRVTVIAKLDSAMAPYVVADSGKAAFGVRVVADSRARDRKSTRLNSSHSQISYAVFCLKKKKKQHTC